MLHLIIVIFIYSICIATCLELIGLLKKKYKQLTNKTKPQFISKDEY
jgi:cytochrome oxidase Cu insertion factor (SCO1/SenC/PrrC family)